MRRIGEAVDLTWEKREARLVLIAERREKAQEEDYETDSCASETYYVPVGGSCNGGSNLEVFDEEKEKWNKMTKAGLRACLVKAIAYRKNGGEDCPVYIASVSNVVL